MLENYVVHSLRYVLLFPVVWCIHTFCLQCVCVWGAIIDCPHLEQVDEHMRRVFLTPHTFDITSLIEGGYGKGKEYHLKARCCKSCCGLMADLGFIPLVFWHPSTAVIVLWRFDPVLGTGGGERPLLYFFCLHIEQWL